MNGQDVAINVDEGLKVEDAKVTRFDILAKNGVIQAIDEVLLPN